MFERRLRLFFAVLFCLTLVLAARAMQLQVFQKRQWQDKAAESLKRVGIVEPTRGQILDVRGKTMAEDAPFNDAAVDYRAIVKDADWIKEAAKARLREKPERLKDRDHRAQFLDEEAKGVEADIDAMWGALARLSGKSIDEIEEIKASIIRRVELRRRSVWYARYEAALRQHEHRDPPPWYKRWLVDDTTSGPQLDQFAVTVGEQVSSHVILQALDTATYNELAKNLKKFPGLELKRSYHRHYLEPANLCAAHLLGHLSAVTQEDLLDDPNVKDQLKRYYPNDLVGRSGLEAMAEPNLRGSIGKTERQLGSDKEEKVVDEVAGRPVTCTIDLDLQSQIMQSFRKITLFEPDVRRTTPTPVQKETMEGLHGAAVVIDVRTGEVRAMVTYPTYDANRFDLDYARLAIDDVDKPLMNRAVAAIVEPGSSVKTVVGSYGVTHGFVGVNEGIECRGYLYINGKKYGVGRCWVARMYEKAGIDITHHTIPFPHRGHDGNADGFLSFSDALQRSCNVYFETLADRMGLIQVATAMHDFGLGQKTGVGLADESAGFIPRGAAKPFLKTTTWFAGIGQGQVRATPIQMANVAATLARDGMWVRPRLLRDADAKNGLGAAPDHDADDEGDGERAGEARLASAVIGPSSAGKGKGGASQSFEKITFPPRTADRADLHLSPQALAAVREGMIRVVNTRAGTGVQAHREDMYVAAKTGSAQAGKFTVPVRDTAGKIVRDEKGQEVRHTYEPNDPQLPWYKGVGEDHKALAHAWYIGYAPADHPQVAFAVMVEYGGAGGHVAGNIAREVLDACVECGYLRPPPVPPANKGWIEE